MINTGMKVMVLVNLWQPAGICNGGEGIVRDVVFERDSKENSLPKFVVVEIPAYTGPPFPKWKDDPAKAKWVPVPVYISSIQAASGQESRSARHQIPIALTRALTHHKAQGMSLEKIFIKLYNTSSSGVTRLHNKQGILYTALSRCTTPATNLLIEYFKPDVLDAIANSEAMKAMRDEFVKLEAKARDTAKWADPLLKEFDRLFDKAQHCRQSTVTLTSLPVPPEKAITAITQPSKSTKTPINADASTRDFMHSRGMNAFAVPQNNESQSSNPTRKTKKRPRGGRRPRQDRSNRPTTRAARAKRHKPNPLEVTVEQLVGITMNHLCYDTSLEYATYCCIRDFQESQRQ